MDVLSGGRLCAAVAAVAVLVAGCGGERAVTEPALPPARSAPPPAVVTGSPGRPASPATSANAAAPAAAPRARPAGLVVAAGAAAFARLQAQLGGPVGVALSAVGVGQPVETLGPLQSAVAWSTSKLPIAMAIYARGLADAHRQDLEAAITVSDNAAAERLWGALGGGERAAQAADAELRAAGDTRTAMQAQTLRPGYTPFGQTVWTLADQTRFTAGMACLPEGASVLGLMGSVVPGQRWGLGAAGVPVRLKGGWGPGSQPGVGGGYLDRQTGIVVVRGVPVVVSIAALPSDGSHQTGVAQLTALARWAVANVQVGGLPRRATCG